ncbi:MAG: tail fiber protein [Isosphaeraceae bacterium]
MDPYIGEIALVGFSFAPIGWALCNGQLLPIDQYDALFALIGTTYGGNGTTNFAVPDLRGRVPIHIGQSSGLSNYVLGQKVGVESVTLGLINLPAHSHTLSAVGGVGSTSSPVGAIWAASSTGDPIYQTATPNRTLGTALQSTGGGAAHSNRQPYLGLNYIIALEGIFPTSG